MNSLAVGGHYIISCLVSVANSLDDMYESSFADDIDEVIGDIDKLIYTDNADEGDGQMIGPAGIMGVTMMDNSGMYEGLADSYMYVNQDPDR